MTMQHRTHHRIPSRLSCTGHSALFVTRNGEDLCVSFSLGILYIGTTHLAIRSIDQLTRKSYLRKSWHFLIERTYLHTGIFSRNFMGWDFSSFYRASLTFGNEKSAAISRTLCANAEETRLHCRITLEPRFFRAKIKRYASFANLRN